MWICDLWCSIDGSASGMLRVLAICIWLSVPLHGAVTVRCHRYLWGAVICCAERYVNIFDLFFGACILWSYGTYCLTCLRVWGLVNARCELNPTVDLCRPISAWILADCDFADRPGEQFHELFWLIMAKRQCSSNYFVRDWSSILCCHCFDICETTALFPVKFTCLFFNIFYHNPVKSCYCSLGIRR